MTRQLDIYNLKFEWAGEMMEIPPYTFVPAEDYCGRYRKLQHLVNVGGGYCGSTKAVTGQHQVTGSVLVPDHEPPAALAWPHSDPTGLDDILLLLSIFTGRKVFALDLNVNDGPIIADPRQFHYGGGVGLSLGQISRPGEFGSDYAQNLSAGTSEVLALIRSDAWRSVYGEGKFLLLFLAACQMQIIESSFMLCWAIWEHLFRLRNEHWLSRGSLRRMNTREKIHFLLTEFGVCDKISADDAKSVDRMARMRHALVHDAGFEKDEDASAADLFVRLTEYIISRVLGLEPSEVFSPRERFERYGRGKLLQWL